MDKRTERAFLGKARHNLKNPVNAILGYSEMLIEDCEDEGLDHLISDISPVVQFKVIYFYFVHFFLPFIGVHEPKYV